MTDKEFDKIWNDCKRLDAQRTAEFEALPKKEQDRLKKEYSDPTFERFWDNPLGEAYNTEIDDTI